MKLKQIMKTVDVLNKYNDWRTGSEIPQPSPRKLTKHINRAIIMLLQYAGELERSATNPTSVNNDHETYFELRNLINSVIVPKEENPKFYVGQTVYDRDTGDKCKIHAIIPNDKYPVRTWKYGTRVRINFSEDAVLTEQEYKNSKLAC